MSIDLGLLLSNSRAFTRRFVPQEEFGAEIIDPGRAFKHPRRRDLRLRDLLIYPDLRQRMFEKRLQGQKSVPSTIYSENVPDHLLKVKKALILGPSESGKTALARALYSDFQTLHHLVPILVKGEEIMGHTANALRRAVQDAVSKQYSSANIDEYFQLPPEQKVLLIDDFQGFRYNSKGQERLLRDADKQFGMILVFADDLFRYEELSEEGRACNPFATFDHCDIKPLGFRLRHQLIRKWVLLGQEYRISQADVFHEVERRERAVDEIIRGELIPAHALIVLLILQACEIDPNQAINSGTYGYLNDFLITRALANISKQITDIGMMSTYLSYLAYAQFVSDKEEFSRVEFDVITARYVEEYGLTLSADSLVKDLTDAQLLSVTNGVISFRYRHYYFYFVAKFFRDNIEGRRESGLSSQLQDQLREVADNIYFDPYLSILTFYLYFKKDEHLIEHLLSNSRQIYAEHRPCDLDTHVEFLNNLYDKKPDRSLPEPNPDKRHEEIRRGMDEDADGRELPRPAKLKYSNELQDYLKINIALKTMQVLGQVLKDSPGQLQAKLKADIAEECYSIGLRTLRAVLGMAEANLTELQQTIEELIKERRSYDPEARIPKHANQFLLWLCLGASLGIIRRTSRAVGHNQLEKTYRDVLERFGHLVSAELIDFSIRLDHFHQLSPRRLEGLIRDRLRSNIFGFQIVQDLVYNYYALFPSDRSERQQICKLVGITPEDPRFLDVRLKRLPPGGRGNRRKSKKRRR